MTTVKSSDVATYIHVFGPNNEALDYLMWVLVALGKGDALIFRYEIDKSFIILKSFLLPRDNLHAKEKDSEERKIKKKLQEVFVN